MDDYTLARARREVQVTEKYVRIRYRMCFAMIALATLSMIFLAAMNLDPITLGVLAGGWATLTGMVTIPLGRELQQLDDARNTVAVLSHPNVDSPGGTDG